MIKHQKNANCEGVEAAPRGLAAKSDYSSIIGKTVSCKMDRPLGTAHPRHPEMIYPVNYGFVENVFAPDGAEQDIYLLGVGDPVDAFVGRVIAVVHRFDDIEDKWIVAPEGMDFSDEEIMEKISFQ